MGKQTKNAYPGTAVLVACALLAAVGIGCALGSAVDALREPEPREETTMFESQIARQNVKDSLEQALQYARELEATDDVESPGDDYCRRLIKSIQAVLDGM